MPLATGDSQSQLLLAAAVDDSEEIASDLSIEASHEFDSNESSSSSHRDGLQMTSISIPVAQPLCAFSRARNKEC